MSSTLFIFVVSIVSLVVLFFGAVSLFRAFYRKVPQGTALIINDMSSEPKVKFTGAFVIPVLYLAEEMKISLITLEVKRRGQEGLICRDNIRADIEVAFYLRVNETPEDVLHVAKTVGVSRASDKGAVETLFSAKFSEALKTVGKKFDFVDLFEKRHEFRDEIIKIIGSDLNGYKLEDVAIDYLEQTPKDLHNRDNIMDAEGRRKITEMTAIHNIRTNEIEQDEKLAVTKKNTATTEQMLAMDRQREEAIAVQAREVASIQAREAAETRRIQEESRLLEERARLDAEEAVRIREEDMKRQVEVAEQNRLRVVAIEAERVNRAAELERVTTDKEVQLQAVDRDKVVEKGRMEVAGVIRERVSIEQTVAVAEEKIKETREVSEADRAKQVAILEAEASAEEERIRQVKQAEGQAQSADFEAQKITRIADAELTASSKQAEAKKILAEGIQAEEAASGLAQAKVQEAQAGAIEKTGLAEARVLEAKADATYKQGNAEARVTAERLAAEAEGRAKMGEADASAARLMGEAEGVAVSSKMKAEAEGLTYKFEAMSSMSPEAREHEELRLRLETALNAAMAELEAQRYISKDRASVLAEALKASDIKLIGGDGGVFDKLTAGMGTGAAVDGALQNDSVQQLMGMLGGLLHKVTDKSKD